MEALNNCSQSVSNSAPNLMRFMKSTRSMDTKPFVVACLDLLVQQRGALRVHEERARDHLGHHAVAAHAQRAQRPRHVDGDVLRVGRVEVLSSTVAGAHLGQHVERRLACQLAQPGQPLQPHALPVQRALAQRVTREQLGRAVDARRALIARCCPCPGVD